MKSRGGKSQRREEKRREEERRSKRESLRRKKIQVPEKVAVFFQSFVAPEDRKVGLLKRRVRSPLGRWEMKNCTQLWREAHFEVKSEKNWRVRTTFGSWDVEKVHAVVARSTFRTQKCTKHTRSGALLEVEILKKCMPLWREAHFEVKIWKTPHARTTFGRSDVVSRDRRTGLCTLSNMSKTVRVL